MGKINIQNNPHFESEILHPAEPGLLRNVSGRSLTSFGMTISLVVIRGEGTVIPESRPRGTRNPLVLIVLI